MVIKRVGVRPEDRVQPRGVHFPFMKRADGLPSGDGPPNIFVSNVKQILLTTFGERVMRPTFGCGLRGTLFEPIPTNFTEERIRDTISRAIALWEPRVSIEAMNIQIQETMVIVRLALLSPFGSGATEIQLQKV
jgi:uncharacterized protein